MAALLHTNRKQAVRRVAVMFVLALLGLVVVGRMFGNGEPADVAAPTIVAGDAIEITMPERLPAGEDFVIDLDGVEPGSVVRVILDAGYGLRQLAKTPSDTSMTVEVPAYSGPASGLLFVSVVQGDKTATSTMEIEPGEAVDPIDVYLGPRTVIADTQHFVMLVAVPEDIWGNPVAEGTNGRFHHHPGRSTGREPKLSNRGPPQLV